ncbi:MAG: exodeoxyribonuclease VII small subunit [Clostridia bacterium]|nr:exodeoxyribonuclease VII small subunit [Clostridia bacterium]
MSENMNFESNLLMLDELVKKLEGANVSLDDSLNYYEEAIRLVGVCNEYLYDAEKKVKILTESLDGTVSDRDFLEDGNEA